MKEIYCFNCRRYKRADLFADNTRKNNAVCISCSDAAHKAACRTQEERSHHHKINVNNGKHYKKHLTKADLKGITGEE